VHRATRTLRRLPDRIGNRTCLANAQPNLAFIIPNDRDNAEVECATTLNNFGDSRNIDYTLVKFFSFFFK
jgi:hypothetical protein